MTYSHIVFDVDGTLVDNEKVVLTSLQETIKQTDGRHFDLTELHFALGIPGIDTLTKLNISNPDFVISVWEQNSRSLVSETQLFQGIFETLNELKSREYNLGIITSKTKQEFSYEIENKFYDIIPFFGFKVFADSTKLHKPNAEPMLFYINNTNTKPNEILYIGDSIYDYECANKAGVDFGLADWGSESKYDAVKSAKYYFNNPKEILNLIISN